jgi:hypothetical protein
MVRCDKIYLLPKAQFDDRTPPFDCPEDGGSVALAHIPQINVTV